MTLEKIKPGYALFITSYLGDADYYNTEIITGLSISQAKLVERFVRRCVSGYNEPKTSLYNENGDGFDMERVLNHFDIGEIENLFLAVYPGAVLDSFEDTQVAEALRDLTYDLLGGTDPNTNYLRCFSSLKIASFSESHELINTLL